MAKILIASIKSAPSNLLVNGAFDLWQRGTTRSAPLFGGFSYTADRWALSGGNGFIAAQLVRQTFTVGQTELPGEPTYYGKIFGLGLPGTDAVLEQRVEGVRTLVGKQATFSCWIKRESGAGAVGGVILKARQNFGTGGSPSSDVEFFVSPETFTTLDQWVRVSGTFTVPSISGKTIGTGGGDYLAVSATCKQTGWNIAQCMLNEGSLPALFIRAGGTLDNELRHCQRYFEKSYDLTTNPGSITDSGNFTSRKGSETSTLWRGTVEYKVVKRATPVLTIYSNRTGASGVVDIGNSITAPAALTSNGLSSFGVEANGSTGNPHWNFQWTSDAEL